MYNAVEREVELEKRIQAFRPSAVGRLLQWALGVGVLAGLAGAQPIPLPECDDFLRLEQLWNDAHIRGDVKALEDLWTDDISIIVPRMRPLTKADAVEMWRAVPVNFTRYESHDITARCFGDTAVVIGRILRVRDFGGKTAEERWQFTKVYRSINTYWRVVAFHASLAPE